MFDKGLVQDQDSGVFKLTINTEYHQLYTSLQRANLIFNVQQPGPEQISQDLPGHAAWNHFDRWIVSSLQARDVELPSPPGHVVETHQQTLWDFVEVTAVPKKKPLHSVKLRAGVISPLDFTVQTLIQRFGVINPIRSLESDPSHVLFICPYSATLFWCCCSPFDTGPRFQGNVRGKLERVYREDLGVSIDEEAFHGCFGYRVLWGVPFNGASLNVRLLKHFSRCKRGMLNGCPTAPLDLTMVPPTLDLTIDIPSVGLTRLEMETLDAITENESSSSDSTVVRLNLLLSRFHAYLEDSR